MGNSYWDKIRKFNRMYGKGNLDKPRIITRQELINFKSILSEEVEEIEEIISALSADYTNSVEIATDVADWLGDIIVYCSTKATEFGLGMEDTLDIIMESNFSKLGNDGLPIIDERGKIMKGPDYWKPEPQIRKMLLSRLSTK